MGHLNPSPWQDVGAVFKGNDILPVCRGYTQHSMAYDVHNMQVYLSLPYFMTLNQQNAQNFSLENYNITLSVPTSIRKGPSSGNQTKAIPH
jgi:hypothetical protein